MIIIMKTIGIIAEFNPFHNGHRYLIEQARKQTGADFCIIVMSGSYVQRGEPAVIGKIDRVRCALKSGADLVLELPVSYSSAGAEAFAHGGISILNSLGMIDHICFGAETDDPDALRTIAGILNDPPEEYVSRLKHGLKEGLSYPAARAAALPEYADILNGSNNILGIEYIKALDRLKSVITPVSIKRIGTDHNEVSIGEYASAMGIRQSINKLPKDLNMYMPTECAEILWNSLGKSCPVTLEDMHPYLDHALLTMNTAEIAALQDLNTDLANRIVNKYLDGNYNDISDFIVSMRTKELTYTRLSRALLHIILNLADMTRDGEGRLLPCPYTRILGFKKEARALMHELKDHSLIPLINKPADAGALFTDRRSSELFEAGVRADRMYDAVAARKFGFHPADTMRTGPLII